MPLEEQIRRNRIMRNRLRRYDVVRWAKNFLNEIVAGQSSHEKGYGKLLSFPARRHLIQQYCGGARRLFLLDYDGTLVPYVKRPSLARPGEDLLKILNDLAINTKNEIVLTSGRDRATLQSWFGSLPVGLIAEHGVWLKERHGAWSMIRPLASDWKPKLRSILQLYADRLPGAFVEEKDFCLAWHFRGAEEKQAAAAARELTDDLITLTANIDVQILQGNKVVEVRCAGVNKGIAAQEWLSRKAFDFMLAIGDDSTDEEMFAVLPEKANSIRVGVPPTKARFHLRNPEEVLGLLTQMVREEGSREEVFGRRDGVRGPYQNPTASITGVGA